MEIWFWILGWSLSILAMAGNGIVIFLVSRKRQLRTKTNAFVVSLAAADFCVGMTAVPSRFYCRSEGTWCSSHSWLSLLLLHLWGFVVYASGTNLCSLVLDRYIAVVKPLKYLTFMKRRRVIQMISISWGAPFAFTVLVSTLRFNYQNLPLDLIFSINGWLYTSFELIVSVLLIFCFGSMLRVVCKHDHKARALAKQLHFNHRLVVKSQGKSAVKMMGIVVGVFLLCYGIFMRCNFVLIFSDQGDCYDFLYKVPLQVVNSAINPAAYAFFKRDIKNEFQRLISSLIPKKRT